MSINASSYVVNTTSPSVPRISVNVQTVTAEAVTSATSVYLASASEYANWFSATVGVRDYVADRLMKDLAGEAENMTSGGINKVDNTVVLHVKADDLYGKAAGTASLNSVNAVNAVVSAFNSLYETYYTESDACVLDTSVSCYESAVTYDTMAITIAADVSVVSSGSIFIKDAPNAIGDNRTYTNYVESSGDYVPQFTISRVDQISGVQDSACWVIAEAGETTAIAYSVDADITDANSWVEVEQ